MRYSMAILANINLLPETRKEIRKLYGMQLVFPDDDPDAGRLIERTGNAGVILVSPGTKLGAEYFNSCPSVKHVAVCGTSTANIDLISAAAHGVQVNNITHYGDDATAETVINRLHDLVTNDKTRLRNLTTAHMGVIGLGAVGSAVATHARIANMHVSYFGPHQKSVDGVDYKPLPELLSSGDVIVLCGPGNKKTLGQAEFEVVKARSILVQVSSGEVTDVNAFRRWALEHGNFALLDAAASKETRQALSDLPNVLISEQHSGLGLKSRQLLGSKVVNTLELILTQLR